MVLRSFMFAFRWLIAAVFVWAGTSKLAHAFGTTSTVSATVFDAIVGDSPIRRIGFALCELLLALWLVANVWRRMSALVTLVLLSSFSGAIAFEATRPAPRPCGCLTSSVHVVDPAAVRRGLVLGLGLNVLLMTGACALIYKDRPTEAA